MLYDDKILCINTLFGLLFSVMMLISWLLSFIILLFINLYLCIILTTCGCDAFLFTIISSNPDCRSLQCKLSKWWFFAEFIWKCILRKQNQKLLAIILGTMSAAILLAEATLLPSGVDLSLFSILVNSVKSEEVFVQVIISFFVSFPFIIKIEVMHLVLYTTSNAYLEAILSVFAIEYDYVRFM